MEPTRQQVENLLRRYNDNEELVVLKEGEHAKKCWVVTCPQITSTADCGIFYHPDRCRHAQFNLRKKFGQ